MPLPDDYFDALIALAFVGQRYRDQVGGDVVLVGGGATAILTDGMFPSFDFDLVAPADDVLKQAMLAEGFIPEDRPGWCLRGYYHPDHPNYGFEHVGTSLFEGAADRNRLIRLAVQGPAHIVLPSAEDLIADRLAQHSVASPTDDSRLRQARMLFGLAERLDRVYLLARIRDEGGDPALLELQPDWEA